MRIACSHEPLSSAILDDLELLHVRERLPGYGLLFETRDHLLQTLHLSLREYLTSAERSGAHAVALVPAHCELARLCLRTLREKRSGPTLDYAVKYGHVHLTAAAQALLVPGSAMDDDLNETLRMWAEAFLEPRPAAAAPTARAPAPEPERAAAAGEQPREARLVLSPWRARKLCGVWVERQAEHGRSQLLVPELRDLELALQALAESLPPHERVHGLWQLVRGCRWGMGAFWAPNDSQGDREQARQQFQYNLLDVGPWHASAALARFGPERLRFPLRDDISPQLHALRGHSEGVSSVAFNHDGTQIVSGSEDNTVCVWDARTGEVAQTLRGHSGVVWSVAFNHDGTQIVSGSGDRTMCVC